MLIFLTRVNLLTVTALVLRRRWKVSAEVELRMLEGSEFQTVERDYKCSEFQFASEFPENGEFPVHSTVFLEDNSRTTRKFSSRLKPGGNHSPLCHPTMVCHHVTVVGLCAPKTPQISQIHRRRQPSADQLFLSRYVTCNQCQCTG